MSVSGNWTYKLKKIIKKMSMERTRRVRYNSENTGANDERVIDMTREDLLISFQEKVKEFVKFQRDYLEEDDPNDEYEFYIVYCGPLR
jgi:hypothetical protein